MSLQTKTLTTGDYAWKSWSNGYVIGLTLTEEAVDAAANTSLVSYLFTISNTNNNRFTGWGNSWDISIADQQIPIRNFYFDLGQDYTTQTIASGQLTVTHQADGTLHMPYAVSIPDIQSWNRYGPPAMAISGQWTLTTIPRASTVSCPIGVIGSPVTITIHKAEPTCRHTVSYQFGSLQGVIAEQTEQSELVWTVPAEFYSQIPAQKQGFGTLFCKTWQGDTQLGESRFQFWADIDEAVSKPCLSAVVQDVNQVTLALTGDENVLVRYHSHARASAEYAAQNSAAVKSYTLTHNGKTYTEPEVTVTGAESGNFLFTVTDSRSLTTTQQLTKTVIPYVKLTCDLAGNTPDGDGNMSVSVSGNYFSGSFGAAQNQLTVECRCKTKNASWPDDDSGWQPMEIQFTDTGYTAQTVLTGLDHQKAYTLQARAIDCLETVHSTAYTATAIPVFDWGEKDFAIHGDLQVDGKVLMGDIPVLNTANVQTYYWLTEGGVSLQAVADFLATCKRDCGFLVMLQGTGYPFVGMAVGAVYGGGKYGAFTLYDCVNGAQSRRVHDGAFYEI